MNAPNINNDRPSTSGTELTDFQSRQLDNEFADLTDALLAGREINLSNELHDLAVTARQLKLLISDTEPPSAAFRSRLAHRLDAEWIRARRATPFRSLPGLSTNRIRQLAALVAALVVLVAGAVVLGLQSPYPVTAGFSTGAITPAFVVVAGLFVVVLIGFGLRRRK